MVHCVRGSLPHFSGHLKPSHPPALSFELARPAVFRLTGTCTVKIPAGAVKLCVQQLK